MSAIVCQVAKIEKHPNADRLELLTVTWAPPTSSAVRPTTLVTGAHYLQGQRGVYIEPGSVIPGYLAEDMWLCGRGKANQWHTVETKVMRGIESPGLFCGAMYQKVRDDPRSIQRFAKMEQDGGVELLIDEWITWPFFREHWKEGEDVSAYLGIRNGQ